jgi:hypothetical protein
VRVLTLDLSTKTGWALLDGEPGPQSTPTLLKRGVIRPELDLKDHLAVAGYPWGYLRCATSIVVQAMRLAEAEKAEVLVIEETNLGKNRYSQKMLEFIHCQLAALYWSQYEEAEVAPGLVMTTNRLPNLPNVVYLSCSAWRSTLGLQMTKEDRRNNAKLSKAKKTAELYGTKLDKAALGVKGKVTRKHLAIRFVNNLFGLSLLVKDNDQADAICLGVAYLRGAPRCDGIIE